MAHTPPWPTLAGGPAPLAHGIAFSNRSPTRATTRHRPHTAADPAGETVVRESTTIHHTEALWAPGSTSPKSGSASRSKT